MYLSYSGLLYVGQDRQESKDAAYECPHGRLPRDQTPPCGCWHEPPALKVIVIVESELAVAA